MRYAVLATGLVAALGSCGIGGGGQGERLARALDLPKDSVAICGDPEILGVKMSRTGRAGGCGIADPVRVYAVGDIRLSPSAQVNCGAAKALKTWVDEGAQPAAASLRTRISKLRVAASYACRRRNNRPSGPLSEHAKGNAIDISEVTFANGDVATVLKDWNSGKYAGAMQKMHAAACGPFGVVLGPKADRWHRDHFHFDISNLDRRYCR